MVLGNERREIINDKRHVHKVLEQVNVTLVKGKARVEYQVCTLGEHSLASGH